MTKSKHGKNPIGIFECLENERHGDVLVSTSACQYVYALKGWRPLYWMQDITQPYDIIFERGEYPDIERIHVQIKATTQRSRNTSRIFVKSSRQRQDEANEKNGLSRSGRQPKSEISLRGNMASAKRGGRPTRPHGYDELFAINEEGEYCIWDESALKANASTKTFGKDCKEQGSVINNIHGKIFGI